MRACGWCNLVATVCVRCHCGSHRRRSERLDLSLHRDQNLSIAAMIDRIGRSPR